MNQKKSSNVTIADEPLESERKHTPKSLGRKTRYGHWLKIFLGVIFFILLITVYILAHRTHSKQAIRTDVPQVVNDKRLEVEVLDGAGSSKAAQHMTNVLRSYGYDVVEMKKSAEGMVERSYVIDRAGKLEAAQKIAEKLGIAPDKVFQKIDRNVYLDITVMIGKDCYRLKAFQTGIERSVH